ncbi:MAG TPA: L,D-transpeptidase family protein, partial [Myxococcota bacterium]|nr:L,D-transpeptidase family protein [Myxococcota bacterium]
DDLLATFDAFARDPRAALEALVPRHPYYAATQAGLARYRGFAEAGGFAKLAAKGTLKRGSRGTAVRALAERLAQEGYWEGEAPAVLDEALENAVRAYQATHGFNQDGVVEARHFTSLNVPVETRIRQIELSLQRWRESEVRPDEPTYVRVNLPEFMMEVWTDGALARKHRIVCGNNNWDVDPDAQIEGRLNRTKLFTAAIETVVINPRWHVPARIRKLELDFELLDDPAYYQKNKFVVKTLPDGRELIYQDAGDDNALGRVKFVFPNPYGIFMHDTNLKKYFDREIRAFSHGCIRLQDPFEVANLLLERVNGITPDQVQAMKAKEDPRDVKLKTPVPIFIEYNSVGVDPEGRMMFFADHYGYDRDYFDGKIPYSPEELKLLQRKIRKVD